MSKQPLKIAFLIENYEPHASGGGYYAIFKFAEFLAKAGHSVLIYSIHNFQWVSSQSEGLRVIYRPALRRIGKLPRKIDKIWEPIFERFFLLPLLRKWKPDFLCGVLKDSAIKAVQWGKQLNVPIANFIYECPPWLAERVSAEEFAQHNTPYTQELWSKTKQAYLDSQILFPNSELSRQYNREWLQRQEIADPIYPGVDVEQMPFAVGSSRGQGQILFLGRLTYEKRPQTLIDAWKELEPRPQLHIVGGGPLLEQLRTQANQLSGLHVHGFLDDEALWELFRNCDLLVCPSSFEGFGMPPMQALYYEIPCIASDIPIFRSIYGDRIEYFPLDNVQALKEQMQRLMADPSYRQFKGLAGRKWVLENFTWEKAASQIAEAMNHWMGR